MGGRSRLPIRIAVAVGTGALAVAVGVALLLGNTVTLRNNADATIATNGYLVAVVNLERLVVDAETGLRGYVITGRRVFLQPLNAAEGRFPGAAGALKRAATREQAFVTQADGLVAASHAYLTSYVSSVRKMAAGNLRAAQSYAITLEGKELVDAIRTRTAVLERAVAARQNMRQQAARRSASHAIGEAIAVLVVLTALTILLMGFLGLLALARDRARARSERTADILQRSLLPQELPAIPGCEVAIRFRPAGDGELVGGDFYDVFPIGRDRWALVLGDVCGKGAEAAAATAMARWTLRSFAVEPEDPAESLRLLNESMLRQNLGGRFITLAYVVLNVAGGRAHVAVACAGHPAPILVPSAGEPVALGARGDLLGVWPDVRLETVELELMPGESLIAYTDGVTDQGTPFRPHTPEAMLLDPGPHPSAERLAGLVESYANQLRGAQRDDIAILALRFQSGPGDGGASPGEEELEVRSR